MHPQALDGEETAAWPPVALCWVWDPLSPPDVYASAVSTDRARGPSCSRGQCCPATLQKWPEDTATDP